MARSNPREYKKLNFRKDQQILKVDKFEAISILSEKSKRLKEKLEAIGSSSRTLKGDFSRDKTFQQGFEFFLIDLISQGELSQDLRNIQPKPLKKMEDFVFNYINREEKIRQNFIGIAATKEKIEKMISERLSSLKGKMGESIFNVELNL